MTAHLVLLRRRTTNTETPPITAIPASTSAVAAPPLLELALPAGLGLMVGNALGPLCVGDGLGDGLGEGLGDAEACAFAVCLFFLAPGCRTGGAVDWVTLGVGEAGGVLGLDE
jgi:hypothetical protein